MPRIQSLDLARGFTVLFIPAIHSVMCYSQPSVYTSWLGVPLACIAEGPGGQLFMMLMGIVFTFKLKHDPTNVFVKAIALLAVGYLLNTLKFIVPYSLHLLPEGVMRDLKLTEGNECWQLFSMGDILQFASIASIIIYIIYQSKYYPWIALAISILIIFISPWLWDNTSNDPTIHYILQLFTGQPPRVFFPVFPWIVYPLLGLTAGHCIKADPKKAYRYFAITGAFTVIIGLSIAQLFHQHSAVGFYRTYPGETLWHIGVVLLTLCLWHILSKKVKPNYFFGLLEYMSTRITSIYIIQWIVICWLLPLIGYQTLGIATSLIACAFTTAITWSLSILTDRIKMI